MRFDLKQVTAVLALAGVASSLACAPRTRPPSPAPISHPTAVQASFADTWNAVIDHFATSNVPISAMERESGFITTPRLSVPSEVALEHADCGSRRGGTGLAPITWAAESVVYNVLVRGDEASSTVQVTASWESRLSPFECETNRSWEKAAEDEIKARAER